MAFAGLLKLTSVPLNNLSKKFCKDSGAPWVTFERFSFLPRESSSAQIARSSF